MLLSFFGIVFSVIAVVILFGMTVFVHELGHFLVARWVGMRAEVFSIGFGPAIWKKKVGETEYRISWIPFGGYVMLPQLDPEAMQKIQGQSESDGAEKKIAAAVWWKRILVSLGGPLGNVLFAIILAFIVAVLPPPLVMDKNLSFGGAVIGAIAEDAPAAEAGLRRGDMIVAINGNKVDAWYDFASETQFGALKHTDVVDGTNVVRYSVKADVTNILDGATARLELPVTENEFGHFTVSKIEEAHPVSIEYFTTDFPEGNAPAELAGLKAGDVIVSIGGIRVVGVGHCISLIRESSGEPLVLRYFRKGAIGETTIEAVLCTVENENDENGENENVDSEEIEKEPVYKIGAKLNQEFNIAAVWLQHRKPFAQINGDAGKIRRSLEALFAPKQKGESGRAGKAMGGPVMIFVSMWATISAGLAGTLAFMRFISINLAILNLLPLPVLDGGHIVFALWRGIFGREIHPKILNAMVLFFAILLITLMLFLTGRDISFIGKKFL